MNLIGSTLGGGFPGGMPGGLGGGMGGAMGMPFGNMGGGGLPGGLGGAGGIAPPKGMNPDMMKQMMGNMPGAAGGTNPWGSALGGAFPGQGGPAGASPWGSNIDQGKITGYVSNAPDGGAQNSRHIALERGDRGSGGAPGQALSNFGNMLKNELDKVNQMQNQSDDAVAKYVTGGDIQLHDVIIASNKAEIAMGLALNVRNKMVSAYQEISRMQI